MNVERIIVVSLHVVGQDLLQKIEMNMRIAHICVAVMD